jgi:hypothetical protein
MNLFFFLKNFSLIKFRRSVDCAVLMPDFTSVVEVRAALNKWNVKLPLEVNAPLIQLNYVFLFR